MLYLFIIMFFLFLLLPFSIKFSFKQKWKNKGIKDSYFNTSFKIDIKIFFLAIYRRNRNFKEKYFLNILNKIINFLIDENEKKEKNYLSDLKKEWNKLKRRYRKHLKKYGIKNSKEFIDDLDLKCVSLKWTTKIGFRDPALTGEAVGFIWIIKGIIINYLSQNTEFENLPSLNVVADFKNLNYQSDFHVIFKSNIGYIIFAAIKFIYSKIKGGIYSWAESKLKNLLIRQ